MPTAGDPTTIRSLAVSLEDVVTALELSKTTSRRAALRVTPPFSGRMRARLHVVTDADSETETIHVDPETLLEPDTPPYPTAADTEEQLRADPDVNYTVDRHHDHHVEALARWRRTVSDAIRTRIEIETPAGPHEVDVTTLGDLPVEDPSQRESESSHLDSN